jgi:DNA-binding IclR family transcriptional regulator
MKTLSSIWQKGCALSFGEFAEGGVAEAAVILGSWGPSTCRISMVIPEDRLRKYHAGSYVDPVKRGADQLSELVGRTGIGVSPTTEGIPVI